MRRMYIDLINGYLEHMDEKHLCKVFTFVKTLIEISKGSRTPQNGFSERK